jgi:hypothetical protein
VIAAVLLLLVAALFALGKLFPSDNGGSGNAGAPREARTTTTTRQRTTTTPAAPARQPTRVRLQVVPTGAVWVCLLDARGRKLIGGRTVTPADRLATFSSRRFTVNFGNGQADMKVNGKTLPVADTGGPVGYAVTVKGRTVLPANKRPTCA